MKPLEHLTLHKLCCAKKMSVLLRQEEICCTTNKQTPILLYSGLAFRAHPSKSSHPHRSLRPFPRGPSQDKNTTYDILIAIPYMPYSGRPAAAALPIRHSDRRPPPVLQLRPIKTETKTGSDPDRNQPRQTCRRRARLNSPPRQPNPSTLAARRPHIHRHTHRHTHGHTQTRAEDGRVGGRAGECQNVASCAFDSDSPGSRTRRRQPRSLCNAGPNRCRTTVVPCPVKSRARSIACVEQSVCICIVCLEFARRGVWRERSRVRHSAAASPYQPPTALQPSIHRTPVHVCRMQKKEGRESARKTQHRSFCAGASPGLPPPMSPASASSSTTTTEALLRPLPATTQSWETHPPSRPQASPQNPPVAAAFPLPLGNTPARPSPPPPAWASRSVLRRAALHSPLPSPLPSLKQKEHRSIRKEAHRSGRAGFRSWVTEQKHP
ncbi:hypothetical protein PLESTB_001786000 [Pleodorina starrii]|uniref:Uncharacterized protein n=1 Tax=Pleodorina starrii TaxID=330485 RepID=A0A9W6C195_9CHLO|nr:hypothetical protein PLESTM_001756800 [Pleodorina starrii]GLC61642.1 hypothetical protein PLESTB_001786000 [Pleodorina starrii]